MAFPPWSSNGSARWQCCWITQRPPVWNCSNSRRHCCTAPPWCYYKWLMKDLFPRCGCGNQVAPKNGFPTSIHSYFHEKILISHGMKWGSLFSENLNTILWGSIFRTCAVLWGLDTSRSRTGGIRGWAVHQGGLGGSQIIIGQSRFKFSTKSDSSEPEPNTSNFDKVRQPLLVPSFWTGTGLGAIAFGENGSRSVAKALVIQEEGETCEFRLHWRAAASTWRWAPMANHSSAHGCEQTLLEENALWFSVSK